MGPLPAALLLPLILARPAEARIVDLERIAGSRDAAVLAALAADMAVEAATERPPQAAAVEQSALTAVPADVAVATLPVRLASERMVPEKDRNPEWKIGTLKAYIKGGKMVSSDRTAVRLRIDGVLVMVEFDMRSIEHPERILGFGRIDHTYDMVFLRRLHGYYIGPDGKYYYDEDTDDPHQRHQEMPREEGLKMDRMLQRGIEVWLDRAMTMILVNMESSFKEHKW